MYFKLFRTILFIIRQNLTKGHVLGIIYPVKNRTKTANILAILLSCIFTLCFFATIFESTVFGETTTDEDNPTIEEGETNNPDPSNPEVVVTPENEFPAPPKFVTAVSAWKYAETKLFGLSHWESSTNQECVSNVPLSGMSIKSKKSWSGEKNCWSTYSATLLAGKTFGSSSFTRVEMIDGVIWKRETKNQTDDREPIWTDEAYVYPTEEFLRNVGTMPLAPCFNITSSTTLNGTSRPLNDGSKITFSLELKSSALEKYITQIKDATKSSTDPVFGDGAIRLDVVLNAKTGYFISIKTTETYKISLLGISAVVSATGKEIFSNFVK